jgi:hypothetical protein
VFYTPFQQEDIDAVVGQLPRNQARSQAAANDDDGASWQGFHAFSPVS